MATPTWQFNVELQITAEEAMNLVISLRLVAPSAFDNLIDALTHGIADFQNTGMPQRALVVGLKA